MSEMSKKRYQARPEYSGLYSPDIVDLSYHLEDVEEITCLYCGAYIEDPEVFEKCPNCGKLNMLFAGESYCSQVIVPTRADLTFMLQAHHDLRDVKEGLEAFTRAKKEGFKNA